MEVATIESVTACCLPLGEGPSRFDAAAELQTVVGDENRLRPVDDQRRLGSDILYSKVRRLALKLVGAVDELDRGAVGRSPNHEVLVRVAQVMGRLLRWSCGRALHRAEKGGRSGHHDDTNFDSHFDHARYVAEGGKRRDPELYLRRKTQGTRARFLVKST